MEMHQVRYFLAVAQELNFSRAAQKCNVSQPSLSRAIQQLEGELGGPLFHRERHLTHLTELVGDRRSRTQQSDTASVHCGLGECPCRQYRHRPKRQNDRSSQNHLEHFDRIWASMEKEYSATEPLDTADLKSARSSWPMCHVHLCPLCLQ